MALVINRNGKLGMLMMKLKELWKMIGIRVEPADSEYYKCEIDQALDP